MALPESSITEAMRTISGTGKSADLRSRRLLDVAQVVSVRVDRGAGGQTGFQPAIIATVRMPFHWTTSEGRIRWGMIPDVHMSAPVAIGDMVVLETIGRGFAATYIGSPAIQPMPLHVSALVTNLGFQVVAQGPGNAAQWYRKLGTFSVRGESSAFIASATFEELAQTGPAPVSLLPDTAAVSFAANVPAEGAAFPAGTADLSALTAVLETGLIFDAVAFTVRLAALGPHDDAGNPVRPTDAGAAWIHGEAGAGLRGATLNPGHVSVVGNRGLTASFDAAFDVGPAGAGRRYDLYLLVTPARGTPTYTATSLRLNVLEAAWNTAYQRAQL